MVIRYNHGMISRRIKTLLQSPTAGAIRKMFEEGSRMKRELGEGNVYDFSLGNPCLEPPREVEEAVARVAAGRERGRHGYMPNAGYDEAREAMAKKISMEQGAPVGASRVVMSCGAAGALNVVLKSILNEGDEVVIPCPYFSEYDHYVQNHGGVVVRAPTRADFSLDADAIASALTSRTAAVIINSPNNPTGRVYAQKDISALAAVLAAHGEKTGRLPFLICDEPYRDITYGKAKVAPVFGEYKNSVIVTSFAKNLSLPGERAGFLAVNPECGEADELVAAAIFSTRILGFVNAGAFFQKVVAASWNAPLDFSPYEKRRDALKKILDESPYEYAEPDGAFYLFVKVPPQWNGDDIAFTARLKASRVLCAPGSSFAGPGYFRAAYCVPLETIESSRASFIECAHSAPAL